MKRVINKEYESLEDFVAGLPGGTFEKGGKVLHDGRNTVKLFEVDGKKVVVKRFKKPHAFNRLMYTYFRGTKAERAYRNARILDELEVDTPTAIAYIDIMDRGLVANSYLVTEYTDFKAVKDLQLEEKLVQVMGVDALVEFMVSLHTKGIQHNDFNQTNVLYRRNGDMSFDFALIDINRMNFGYMSKLACMSNLRRICEDPSAIYMVSQKYAEKRGWNRYHCLTLLSFYRSLFERRNSTKLYLRGLKRKSANA